MTSQPGPDHRTMGRQARQQARAQRTTGPQAKPTVNKTRVGGGFNPSINPAVSISINKGGGQPGPGGQGAAPAAGRSIPGSDFNSNEDIQAFCEHNRRKTRTDAVELALAAEHLEAVLRHIPDTTGSMAGARLRARRVSRHLKKAAKAQQLAAKAFASCYAQFQREYEAELSKVGKARPQQQPRNFGWR